MKSCNFLGMRGRLRPYYLLRVKYFLELRFFREVFLLWNPPFRPTGISNARWPLRSKAAESFEGTNCGALPRKLPVSNAQRSKCGIKKCVSFNTNNIIKNYRFNKYNSCESNLNTLQYNEILTIHTLITLNNEIKKLTQIKEALQQNIHAIKSKRFLYSNLIDHDEY